MPICTNSVPDLCRNAQVGLPCSRACSACHTSMTVQFQAAMFVAAAPAGDAAQRSKRGQRCGTGARAALDPALVLGQPLPHMGTCKHYHHSHRCPITCHVHDSLLPAGPNLASSPEAGRSALATWGIGPPSLLLPLLHYPCTNLMHVPAPTQCSMQCARRPRRDCLGCILEFRDHSRLG